MKNKLNNEIFVQVCGILQQKNSREIIDCDGDGGEPDSIETLI